MSVVHLFCHNHGFLTNFFWAKSFVKQHYYKLHSIIHLFYNRTDLYVLCFTEKLLTWLDKKK